MGYHRLPELSMYWERQPDTGYGLGIVHQAMTHERVFNSFQNTWLALIMVN